MKDIYTPIQDSLDVMEGGGDVNLSIPFDDTVQIFQSIDDVEYLACTFDELETYDQRRSNNLITEELQQFVSARKKWCRFPVHNFRLMIHVASLGVVETIEPDDISKAYAHAKPTTIYEKMHTLDFTQTTINAIEKNELLKDVLITTIVHETRPTTWIDVDGNKSNRLSVFLLIYGYDVTKNQSINHSPNALLPSSWQITTDIRVPKFAEKTLIRFDGICDNRMLSWNSNRLNVTKALTHNDVDLDAFAKMVTDYFDNNDYILLQNCTILRNINMDGSEVLIVNGRYLCPDISRDFVNDYIHAILDGFLDNR